MAVIIITHINNLSLLYTIGRYMARLDNSPFLFFLEFSDYGHTTQQHCLYINAYTKINADEV